MEAAIHETLRATRDLKLQVNNVYYMWCVLLLFSWGIIHERFSF